MSSPCGRENGVVVPNHESLRRVLSWLLPPAIFAACRGGDKWKPRALAFAAMLWAWGGGGRAEAAVRRGPEGGGQDLSAARVGQDLSGIYQGLGGLAAATAGGDSAAFLAVDPGVRQGVLGGSRLGGVCRGRQSGGHSADQGQRATLPAGQEAQAEAAEPQRPDAARDQSGAPRGAPPLESRPQLPTQEERTTRGQAAPAPRHA